MNIGEYLIYSLLGMSVVFFALVLLMIIIKIMAKFTYKKHEVTAKIPNIAEHNSANLAPGSAGDISLYDTDPRTAAIVMAIVADEMNLPLNELRFISIKEVEQ